MTNGAIDREAWVKAQGSGLDPRRTLARPDLAFDGLKGKVEAARYAHGRVMTAASPIADLRKGPRASEGLLTQALLGEEIRVLESHSGWAFSQILSDGYVGYIEEKHLASHAPKPTAYVSVPLSHIYPVPDLKSPVRAAVPFGSRVCANIADARGGFAEVKGQGWIYAKHLSPFEAPERDLIETAKMFLDCPYLWGGKTALGLDCSGLVQIALQAAGVSCPRDTDQQARDVGHSISNVPDPSLGREGDLVFFKGHVGFLLEGGLLLHANATNMRVTIDPVKEVEQWVKRDRPAGITDIRRLRRAA